MRAIFPVLGVDASEVPEPAATTRSDSIRFFLDGRNGKGEGEERSDGFLVFAVAVARLDETPSLAKSGNRLRSRLVTSGRLAQDGDHYVLTDDTLFKTPSAAALVLTGAHVNGREYWRDTDGVTLKEHQIRRSGGDQPDA